MREEIGRVGRAAVVFGIRRIAGRDYGGIAHAGNRLDAHYRLSHGRVRGDERGASGVVPALLEGAPVRPRAGGGVPPTGWRGGGRGGRVRALRRAAAAGGTVPGGHGNRRERAPGVHRPARVRFRRSAGCAGGGTRRRLPHAAGTRWSVRKAGGCAAARPLADGAVLPAGAAGVGVRQRRAQGRGGAGGAGRAYRGSVSGVYPIQAFGPRDGRGGGGSGGAAPAAAWRIRQALEGVRTVRGFVVGGSRLCTPLALS